MKHACVSFLLIRLTSYNGNRVAVWRRKRRKAPIPRVDIFEPTPVQVVQKVGLSTGAKVVEMSVHKLDVILEVLTGVVILHVGAERIGQHLAQLHPGVVDEVTDRREDGEISEHNPNDRIVVVKRPTHQVGQSVHVDDYRDGLRDGQRDVVLDVLGDVVARVFEVARGIDHFGAVAARPEAAGLVRFADQSLHPQEDLVARLARIVVHVVQLAHLVVVHQMAVENPDLLQRMHVRILAAERSGNVAQRHGPHDQDQPAILLQVLQPRLELAGRFQTSRVIPRHRKPVSISG